MISGNEELPRLNYLWIGPPKTDAASNAISGSDVKDVISMAKNSVNPISYYCLDEHAEHYKNVFKMKNANVKVQSIDEYLDSMLDHKDKKIRKHADTMIKMRKELLKPPRDRIIDRVAFKDAFSLFLLATQGGYTLDTSIKLGEGEKDIAFKTYDQFKVPNISTMDPVLVDCWMMYAPPHDSTVAMQMLDNYLSKWDNIQNIIRGNEKRIENIEKFHSGITELMIKSIHEGLKLIDKENRLDPDWEFTALNSDQSENSSIVKIEGMPIQKQYGNSHKYQFECRQIVIDNINEYINKPSVINREDRTMLLENLKEGIILYSKINDLGGISCINKKLNAILEAAKELDRSEMRLGKVSTFYKSPSNDGEKIQFSKQIDQTIDNAYKSLNEKLLANDIETLPEKAIIKGIDKTVNSFKTEIKKIATNATTYNEKKHSSSHWNKSRFETKTELDTAKRKRRFTL